MLWSALLRALGIRPARSPLPVEERDPALRFVRQQQERLRREIEDRRRAQRLEDQAALWQGEQ